MFHGTERFDVIDDRRAHVKTEHCWEVRWFNARIPALAFERFDKPGFFSADVSARAAMNIKLHVESRTENIFAEKVVLPRFFDGALEDFRAFGKFSAYVDVRRPGVERVTRNQHAFEQLVRIFMNDVAILERARLGFIGVTNQIDRPFFVRLDKAPFQAAGKPGPTATAQPGVFHFVDNVLARQS